MRAIEITSKKRFKRICVSHRYSNKQNSGEEFSKSAKFKNFEQKLRRPLASQTDNT